MTQPLPRKLHAKLSLPSGKNQSATRIDFSESSAWPPSKRLTGVTACGGIEGVAALGSLVQRDFSKCSNTTAEESGQY